MKTNETFQRFGGSLDKPEFNISKVQRSLDVWNLTFRRFSPASTLALDMRCGLPIDHQISDEYRLSLNNNNCAFDNSQFARKIPGKFCDNDIYSTCGSGKKTFSCEKRHENNITNSLKLLGKYILNVAASEEKSKKESLLLHLSSVLSIFDKSSKLNKSAKSEQDPLEQPDLNLFLPSLFLIKITLCLGKVDINKIMNKNYNITSETSKIFGEALGNITWKSRNEIHEKKHELEKPNSLKHYQQSFPSILTNIFNEFIIFLERKKHELFAFPGINIWLTHIMSSLCRKPNLLTSLYAILCTANVVSHTQSHERKLEKIRISETKPKERLLTGNNIWNVSVIDNIDFKEKTFMYGNIYDTTRNSSHATLRMVFQFSLPVSLDQINNNNDNDDNDDDNNLVSFEKSVFTDKLLKKYEKIFNNLLETCSNNWDIDNLYDKLAEEIPLECSDIPPPNVVILEPGENPNCDDNVHRACEMYYNDLDILNSNCLDIAILLGQWHTSKDICSALIATFSGYRIFNLAANFGVKYLDKLEKVVDYQATCHDIENENNNIFKVWYCYFCWAGYWFEHKQGIRKGNYNMQFKNLLAFSPLFPVAGKNNYAKSVTHFLSYVNDDKTLQKLLQYVCSVNLTRPGYYFGFDEALERFGVMFVK
ncbi:unnamed protein product [Rhizophagus irregularis]|nr:unnamed protein product [Rhizophagus irregularis]